MKRFGYKQSQADQTLFIKHTLKGTTTVIVYVDDIVITGDDSEEERRLESHLSNEYEVKDLGTLRYFLGIEVARSKNASSSLRKSIF